jgi:hypothetical protein
MYSQLVSKHKKLPVLNDGNLLGSGFLAEKAYGEEIQGCGVR